ncbi:MAG TPA: ATP-binding protein [Gemmatimonadales bacterium]|nr:ATP-binding protein [Gemmatimonadales bacterium]
MSDQQLTAWSLFLAAVLSVAIVVAALVLALVISQRRRLALEREHARRLLGAQEEERSRVARELHDDALQRLAVIRHELEQVAALAGPEAVHRIGGVSGELEDLGTVLRTAAHQLHPSVVEKAGLVRALGALAEEFGRTSGLDVRLALPPADVAVPPGVGVAAYRIAQEALRNVVRHAGVARADLSLELTDGTLTLRVADAGKGFDAGTSRPEDGLGLIAMRQRAVAVGGHLAVAPAPAGGTIVTATLPGRANA